MQTALYANHLAAGANMTDFAGWQLPLNFGSQLQEHRAVRGHAGIFDVSHMAIWDVRGPDVRAFLRHLLCNDVDRIRQPGGAIYSCLLNEAGGIIDDLIVYRWADDDFRVITNAATRNRVGEWLKRHGAGFDVGLEQTAGLSMLAIQGPEARRIADGCLSATLRHSAAQLPVFAAVRDECWQVARTGYTGEDCYEIILPNDDATALWQCLVSQGAQPCGLAARDTLRLEAGMRLYGADMDETTTPSDAGLGWTVAWQPADRAFIGRQALAQKTESPARWEFAGLVLEQPGVLRAHQAVQVPGLGEGVITSGGFSPALNRSIAFARLPAGAAQVGVCNIPIRDQVKTARIGSLRIIPSR